MVHKVVMSVGNVIIQKAETAPKFDIWYRGNKLGELVVSKGGLEWWRQRAKNRTAHIRWSEFAEFANTIGEKKEARNAQSSEKSRSNSVRSATGAPYSKQLRREIIV